MNIIKINFTGEFMSSPMLDAFMASQKYTDEEAIEIENRRIKFQEDRMDEAALQLAQSQRIADRISIPSQIKDGELDNVTEAHPQMNHNHSLDMTRIKFSQEGSDILVDGIHIPEPEPEGLRLLPNYLPASESPVGELDSHPGFGIDWDSLTNTLEDIV